MEFCCTNYYLTLKIPDFIAYFTLGHGIPKASKQEADRNAAAIKTAGLMVSVGLCYIRKISRFWGSPLHTTGVSASFSDILCVKAWG